MSKSEKRYFTIDAQKSGRKGSKYLDLFQAISSMDEYDEAKLKKKFPKNLPSDKAYLYEAILRSMRDYRSAKSKSAQIKEMILDSKYLYERGLYMQSEERLKEAKDLAKALNEHLVLLEINREEILIAGSTNKEKYSQAINELTIEKDKSIQAINEEFDFLDLYCQLFEVVNKKFDIKNEQVRESIKESFEEKILSQERPQSSNALRRYLQSKALYYQLLRDFNKVYEYFTKVVDWWDKHPDNKQEEFYRYIVDSSNLLHAYTANNHYNLLKQLLDKLEKEAPIHYHDQVVLFQKVTIYKLMYYINSGEVDDSFHKFIEEIDVGLDKYSIKGGSRLSIIFNVALLFFIQGNFDSCRVWVLKIIKDSKSTSRQDIKTAGHLLILIAVFETGNLELLDKTLRSTNRYLQKVNRLNKKNFEYQFFHFIKKLSNAPLNEVKGVYQEFRSFLGDVLQNPKLKHSLGLDELTYYWVDSKIANQSISYIMQKKKAI